MGEFNIEVFGELPEITREGGGGGGRKSVLADLVNQVIEATDNGEIPVGAAVRIAVYDKPGGSAGCSGQLKKRFGSTPDAYGVKFASRKTEDGYSVFVMYDPELIVPGAAESVNKEFAEYQEKLRDQARQRAEAKSAA